MQEIVKVGNNDLQIREWKGQRVVTLADIDRVHERPGGTAKTRFYRHKDKFAKNEDYYIVKPSDVLKYTKDTLGIEKVPNRGLTLITESGYLMIVKTYDDDLAWKVQRDLVNTYFKFKEVVRNFNSNYPIDTKELTDFLLETRKNLPCVYAQINNMEEMLGEVIDSMTLSTRQQEKIHETARKRINYLLGGAHSEEYKRMARTYMINLWNGVKAVFHCGSSYKDLDPKDFDKAVEYINRWEYED